MRVRHECFWGDFGSEALHGGSSGVVDGGSPEMWWRSAVDP